MQVVWSNSAPQDAIGAAIAGAAARNGKTQQYARSSSPGGKRLRRARRRRPHVRLSPAHRAANVAAEQVRGIIDRFCRGSVENLLVGMVDDNLITPDKLRELAERIEETEAAERKSTGKESRVALPTNDGSKGSHKRTVLNARRHHAPNFPGLACRSSRCLG